jgi:hypothetical protein
MIYTGTDLKVRICSRPTHYHHWMSFACYASLSRYLPDAKVELAVPGRANFFFDWARRFKIPIIQKQEMSVREAANVCLPIVPPPGAFGVLAIAPECIAVRPFDLTTPSVVNESGTACLFRGGEMVVSNSLCGSARSDAASPFADVTDGVGRFDPKKWSEKTGCFLSEVDLFSSEGMSSTEWAVMKEWKKTAAVIATLFASR